ncbi:penicillin-binding protein [Lachnospiraceae bacterium]|nr:penicillin-binding protein [Ruminococcus sp.]NBI59820.1 penicillin-binding protein [Lachnospiraceae bacterium]
MSKRIKKTMIQISESRLLVLILIFCCLYAVLINRLFRLQIVKGEYYMDNYKLQIRKERDLQGTRGSIYDRNGELLAYNELAYSVTFEDDLSGTEDRNETLNRIMDEVIRIVEAHGDSVIHSFGIVLDPAGNYQFSQTNETLRLRFVADVYGLRTIDELSKEQKNATAEDLIHYLCSHELYGYDLDEKKLDRQYILKMINLRYAINLNSYQKYIPTVLASDVSDETRFAIMENLDRMEGVGIEAEYLRRYTDSQYFASLIGYTGKISQEEYDALDEDQKERYALSDIVGKSGIEQVMDNVLQGDRGSRVFYVDSVGKVTEEVNFVEPGAGNDVYLTIDKKLQEQTYKIIEEKIAGVVLSKLSTMMNYDPSLEEDTKNIIIPADDAYFAFIANQIIDEQHFGKEDAGAAEREVYAVYEARKTTVMNEIMAELNGTTPYQNLSAEMQGYMDYMESILQGGILLSEAVDAADPTYQAWSKDESISMNQYLNYAISKNWIDTSRLNEYISSEYSDAAEVYQAILKYLQDYLSSDMNFDKLLYKYLIKSGSITGAQICAIVYEQGVLPLDEGAYQGLRTGGMDSFGWLHTQIQTLAITPGQLALEPCTGSAVVSDPSTGEVLACVSYPGYDNNRLANTMDSDYYNRLVTGLSRPFYNNATQETTAPGSTYKMVSSVAALTEKTIKGDTYISCGGAFEGVTPNPHCWSYPYGHGGLNVVDALNHSCNVFYYTVGFQFGLDREGDYDSSRGIEVLRKYSEGFGLGETSGLEIPETEPNISDTDSVLSAIGQGTNNYTVSQLNRYVSTVANKGTVYKLTLLDRTTDANGKIIKNYEPVVVSEMDNVSPKTWELIHDGMVAMINSTASFSGMGIQMAGKTGTAQQSAIHPDHAVFVGFAPAESPEIAIAVRIANGYTSAYAAEIGRDIVMANFELAEEDELITGQAAKLGESISD